MQIWFKTALWILFHLSQISFSNELGTESVFEELQSPEKMSDMVCVHSAVVVL